MLNICTYQVTGTSILASKKITSFTDRQEVVRTKQMMLMTKKVLSECYSIYNRNTMQLSFKPVEGNLPHLTNIVLE